MAEGVRWARPRRDFVRVAGPEAGTFLQGQLSQDVLAVEPGGSSWSWLLAPNGKVEALLRVWRAGADEWLLETDEGLGDSVVTRLERFRLRTKADVEAVDANLLAVRGAPAPAIHDADLRTDDPWPGATGVDAVGIARSPAAPGGEQLDGERWEAERIAAGFPRWGAELTDRTIPGETGLVPLTVSFTKGCYTGQELVARVDSRGGNVPRRMVSLRSEHPMGAGEDLVDESGAGVLGLATSCAATSDGFVGLGYLKRGSDPPLRAVTSSGSAVEVNDLPWVQL